MSSAPTTTRLPRYRRAATEVSCVVTQRDLEILKTVQNFRLVASADIQALAIGSKQGILRRLQKLYHAGYLDRVPPRRSKDGGSAPMVYAVTNKGIRTLQKEGRVDCVTSTDWNAQNRSQGDLFVDHTLLVSRIRTVFTLASRPGSGRELAFWREGRELLDRVEVALDRGYVSAPIAPDAFFSTRHAKGRSNFFLEADRGTMTIARFMLKLRAYAAYFAEKKHEVKHGIKFFRVLTVAHSRTRGMHLAEGAAALEALRRHRRLFLFTDASSMSLEHPESVLEKIWTIPGESGLTSLAGS